MKIDHIEEKWTKKYKKSIDCSNPKGFSQRAHCAGKKKKKKVKELKIVKPDSVDTKGIKRVEMPQIHKDDYNEFIDYLKDNGAEFTNRCVVSHVSLLLLAKTISLLTDIIDGW
jgi:DNA-directed RNA polymerase delta subunit